MVLAKMMKKVTSKKHTQFKTFKLNGISCNLESLCDI